MSESIDAANQWLADAQQQMADYFSGCTQNEWIAWGVNLLGFCLLVAGIVILII